MFAHEHIILLLLFFFENEDYCYYKNQPGSAKSTSTKCGGTSSTHTNKPLTFLKCLARLWAILLPLLRTWEKLIQVLGPSMDFADSRRWPNEESKDSLLRRELITASESPSSTNFVIPSSCAKTNALAAAMASTISDENGGGACSGSELNLNFVLLIIKPKFKA